MIYIKRSLLKTQDALDCMVIGSLGADIREICAAQRQLTNQNWVETLESCKFLKKAAQILKEYGLEEPSSIQAMVKVVHSVSSKRPVVKGNEKQGQK